MTAVVPAVAGAPPPLSVWLRPDHSLRMVLIARGALTSASIGELESAVDVLGAGPWRQVVMDLRGLTTVDAAGRRVLSGLRHYLEALGCCVEVRGATSPLTAVRRR